VGKPVPGWCVEAGDATMGGIALSIGRLAERPYFRAMQIRRLARHDAGSRTHATVLPADLMAQSGRRLRVVAWLYAFVFLAAGPLPSLLLASERPAFLASPWRWLPSMVSIAVALLVGALTRHPRLRSESVVWLGLAFQVVGSYGIAMAQYLDPRQYAYMAPDAGLSWVAVWMLSFTVIVPSPPRWALVAALASASAVPVISGLTLSTHPEVTIAPTRFVAYVAVPYLLVVLIAYVGARLVYRLGVDLERARELGSYRLIEPMAQGGMGEVWRAQHRLLARPAAVKVIRPEVLGAASQERQSELLARFEREAQATACLQSPHTVHLFDYGVAEDGSFYYVMELLNGFDLKTLVERFGPVPLERAVHLLRQVCHSLAEAHAVGLVHRDVTPANVFVCRYGLDVDFVKVLDFGLVKPQAWAAASDDVTVTRADAAGGTPAFMSPEQALADRPLDGRSDIYAVGCLAYWLVTGELVFARTTPMATLVAHTQAEPVPPSTRTEIPLTPEFDALVLACLAKNPDDRPSTAEELACRLEQLPGVRRWTAAEARAWWDVHHPVDKATELVSAQA
jgi:hypothetical protein